MKKIITPPARKSGAGHLSSRVWRCAPSEDLVARLSEMSPDQLLVGPDRDISDLEVNDIFGARFDVALRDLMQDAGIERGDPRVLLQAVTTPLCDYATRMFHGSEILMEAPEDEIRIAGCDFGTLLLQRRADEALARISGMFWGATLVIDPVSGLRGLGYGRDLVAARLIQDERLPTWDLDTPSYSHLGALTAQSAARAILNLQIAQAPQGQNEADQHLSCNTDMSP